MQAYIDKLSSDLVERYKLYIATLMVDVCGEDDLIEFRFGYSLRHDSRLQSLTFKVGASDALNDGELRAIVDALFSEIEMQIDESIARTLIELN